MATSRAVTRGETDWSKLRGVVSSHLVVRHGDALQHVSGWAAVYAPVHEQQRLAVSDAVQGVAVVELAVEGEVPARPHPPDGRRGNGGAGEDLRLDLRPDALDGVLRGEAGERGDGLPGDAVRDRERDRGRTPQ